MSKKTANPGLTVAASNRIDDCWNRIGVRGDHSCPELLQHVHCRNCPAYSDAAISLLDGELSADYRRQWAIDFAQTKGLPQKKTEAMVVFRVGNEWLGFETRVCSEIAEISSIHSLPHRHDNIVLGLVNVRGELLVCVSLVAALGITPKALAVRADSRKIYSRLIVLRASENVFVTPVDEVFGVVHFHASDLRDTPSTVAQAAATYTRAVLPWQNSLVGYIDHELLIFTLNRSLA
jgi:chemotaxis-related protein WspD